jgi:hypothetical protein
MYKENRFIKKYELENYEEVHKLNLISSTGSQMVEGAGGFKVFVILIVLI